MKNPKINGLKKNQHIYNIGMAENNSGEKIEK